MLHEASREKFMKTLAYPNRIEWVKMKLAIWFGSGWDPCWISQSCVLLIFVLLMADVSVCYLFLITSFHLGELKNFQSKFKRAEEHAMRLLLPRAHRIGIGEDGEKYP